MATLKAKFSYRDERKVSDRPGVLPLNAVFDFLNSMAYIAGLEFTSDWKINLRSNGHLLMNTLLFWSELYTLCLLFPSITCVELTAGMGLSVTLLTKFTFFAVNHDKFMSVVDFIFVVANKNTEGKRYEILSDISKTMFYHFKLIFVGFACGAGVYSFFPVYDFIVNGNLTPISPLIFPFATDDSTRSFVIGTICNMIPPAWNIWAVSAVSCLFSVGKNIYSILMFMLNVLE